MLTGGYGEKSREQLLAEINDTPRQLRRGLLKEWRKKKGIESLEEISDRDLFIFHQELSWEVNAQYG